VLLTNQQVAEISKRNPQSLTALGEVQGIGENKLRDFGTELLAILAAAQATAPQEKNGQEPHAS
jgi:ribonuclease D